jgi:hypothetical protein
VYLVERELPGDDPHLLEDVILAQTLGEGDELLFDVASLFRNDCRNLNPAPISGSANMWCKPTGTENTRSIMKVSRHCKERGDGVGHHGPMQ